MSDRKQISLVKYALRHPKKWHSFKHDRETAELVCACTNLGILKINDHGQFFLKSETLANDFLRARDKR